MIEYFSVIMQLRVEAKAEFEGIAYSCVLRYVTGGFTMIVLLRIE